MKDKARQGVGAPGSRQEQPWQPGATAAPEREGIPALGRDGQVELAPHSPLTVPSPVDLSTQHGGGMGAPQDAAQVAPGSPLVTTGQGTTPDPPQYYTIPHPGAVPPACIGDPGGSRGWSPYSSDEDTECIDMSPAEEEDEPPGGEEATYITTHQIQLCEQDHDDSPGPEPGWWELGDSTPCRSPPLAYDSDCTPEDTQTEGGDSYISTTASETCRWRGSSTDMPSSTHSEVDTPGVEEGGRPRSQGSPGQFRLSITAAPWAINELGTALRRQHSAPAQSAADMSLCAFRPPAEAGAVRQQLLAHDQARQVIAVRGAVHGGYSSGASSAVSELDEADKEVRSLTARAFRSLAYPYFEALSFSSSASSTSLSEQGAGFSQWSSYLDWAGGAAQKSVAPKAVQDPHQPAGRRSALEKTSNLLINAVQSSKSLELVVSGLEKSAGLQGSAQPSAARLMTLSETLSLSHIETNGALQTWSEKSTRAPGHNAPGSVSRADQQVTDAGQLPGTPGEEEEVLLSASKAVCPAEDSADGMEQGAHKKSVFASNLLQNVISKKMQLEQEFKMERGEITDTSKEALSSSLTSKDFEGLREKGREGGIQRQSSRHSEGESEYSLPTPEDFIEFAPEKATASRKDVAQKTAIGKTPKSPSLEPLRSDSTSAALKSAAEAAKASLLRSQHSAFRSWKEKEIQKLEQKIMEEKVAVQSKIKIPLGRDGKAELGETSTSRATKLSSLYVPGIQTTPKENQPEKQATKYSTSTYAHQTCIKHGEGDLVCPSPMAAARIAPKAAPEVKVSMGVSKIKVGPDSKGGSASNPFSIAKLLTPSLARAAEELKIQPPPSPSKGELPEKLPQFLVRDIRESKPTKNPGPLHQVRDVRKLMKSSYHSEETVVKGASSSPSPMIITCQAVNNKEDGTLVRIRPSSPDTILVHRASGRLPVATIAPNKSGPRMPVVKIVSKASKWKQQQEEKPESAKSVVEQPKDSPPPLPTTSGHQALDKLTAAVKTMEQLYVFDKREWRRRSDGDPAELPHTSGAALAGSHVLSLITSEEGRDGAHGGLQGPRGGKSQEATCDRGPLPRRNSHPGAENSSKSTTNSKTELPTPRRIIPPSKLEREPAKVQHQQPPTSGVSKSTTSFSTTQRTAPTAAAKIPQQRELPSNLSNTRTTGPRPLLLTQSMSLDEGQKPSTSRAPPTARQYSADCENYLSIAAKSKDESAPTTAQNTCNLPPFNTKSQNRSPQGQALDLRGREERNAPTRTPAAEIPLPAAAIYQHQQPCLTPLLPGGPATQLIFSPPMTAIPPELLQPQGAQRRLLLDLATGQYFMLDTPTPPAHRRLFDPETGQYVDVPVPQQSVTPMHLPMSPLALSPSAYGATYMICPGFVPTTATAVLPTLQRHLSHPGSDQSYNQGDYRDPALQQGEARGFADSPYYMPTGKPSAQTNPQQVRGTAEYADVKPVISITSQQQPGPRLIAPPSFDGTTMRFVVEHR